MIGKGLRLISNINTEYQSEDERKQYQESLICKYLEIMPVRYANSTIPNFKSAMSNFIPWLGDKGLWLWDVKNKDYDEFVNHLKANISKVTVVNYNFHISSFYSWLTSRCGDEIKQKYGLCVKNPIDEWNTPSRKGEEEELPELPDTDAVNFYFQKEKQKLAEAIENHDRRTAYLLARQLTAEQIMFQAGLRLMEVPNLNVGDIRLEEMLIIVRKGKGNKDRIVDLKGSLANLIKWYLLNGHPMSKQGKQLPMETPLFMSELKKRISKKTLQHKLWAQEEEFGVPLDKRFSPHGFRRLYATNLYMELTNEGQPDPLTYIKMQLGHVFYSTTLRYCRIPQAVISRAKIDAYNNIKRELAGESGDVK